jgi:hypothetical protein
MTSWCRVRGPRPPIGQPAATKLSSWRGCVPHQASASKTCRLPANDHAQFARADKILDCSIAIDRLLVKIPFIHPRSRERSHVPQFPRETDKLDPEGKGWEQWEGSGSLSPRFRHPHDDVISECECGGCQARLLRTPRTASARTSDPIFFDLHRELSSLVLSYSSE